MSTEFENSELLDSPDWTLSVRAQESGRYDALVARAGQAYGASGRHSWLSGSGGPYYETDVLGYEDEDDSAQWDEYAQELFPHSKLYRQSDVRDRLAMTKAWWGRADWIFSTEQATDGLWDAEVAKRRVRFDKMSRLVLSGLLGEGLLTNDKKLREIMKSFELSPLDSAIMVGGAALASTSGPLERHRTGAVYLGRVDDGMQAETWTGGDMHGDFRTLRHMRPVQSVTTSLRPDREHVFMPVVGDHEGASAYHSAEPNIVGALLVHLVEKVGVEPTRLHDELIKKLQQAAIHRGGNFGDYGDNDGDMQARYVRQRLAARDDMRYDNMLFEGIVTPQFEQRLWVSSEEGGVLFANGAHGEKPYTTMMIPNEEIVDYITTVIRGGGGRTSPDAMIAVINALVDEDTV